MNRLVRGSVMLAATLVVLSACGGDPTANNADKPVKVVTDPSVLYVANTDSQAVTAELQNELGQQLAADFTIANVGAGIVVTRDTAFAVVDGNKPNPTKARFFVRPTTATSFVATTFDIVAGGKTATVPVRITPANLSINFSNAAPALGDTVVLTAPANVVFTSASTVTIPSGVAVVAGLSADSTQLFLLLGPGITDQAATVSNVAVTFLPGQTFTLATTGTVTTPTIASIPSTFSNVSPAVGDTVDLVLDPQYRALGSPTITFGSTEAIIAGISVDSQTVRFLPPPGSTGSPTLGNVALSFLTSVPLTVPSSAALTVANTTIYTGTDDPTTAPSFNISNLAVGDTIEFYDLSTNIDQFYKVVVTGASATFTATLSWPTGPDVDILWCNAACSAFVGNFSGATSANPEISTVTFTTGSNFFWANLYAGAAPPWIRIRFIRTA